MISKVFIFHLAFVCLSSQIYAGFVMNQTGGSFPNSVYQQSAFSYNFVAPEESLSYFGPSSSVGKCNVMGYWHTANTDASGMAIPLATKTLDKTICTDKCTVATCGYFPTKVGTITLAGVTYTGLPARNDAGYREPLTDLAASDGLLAPADYFNFPDLQMLPAIAGAVVPVYNIPDLAKTNITTPLILSRSSLVNIFLGLITSWNDPRIITDNAANPRVQKILSKTTQPITIVVRTDSSGTSEVFTDGLGAMSPAGFGISPTGLYASVDNSFYSQGTVGGTTQVPSWCGPLTDELQFITMVGCNTTAPASTKSVLFKMVDSTYTLHNVSFNCDVSAVNARAAISAVTGYDVHVTQLNSTVAGLQTTQLQIGYWGLAQQGKNWNNPIVLSHPKGVAVTVQAKQEGGYLNTVTTCTTVPVTLQTMSVWTLSAASIGFTLTWTSGGVAFTTASISSSPGVDASVAIKAALIAVSAAAVTTVTKVVHPTWTEYQIAFAVATKAIFSTLSSAPSTSLYVTTLLTYSNYPCFYDSAHPRGYARSGRYTCYRRQQNFIAWSYYAGASNPGVVAEVISRPYAIGYSVLEIALAQNLPTASMINKAGATVVATSQSVAFAIMDKGGNLNSLFQANLADGASSNVWPISGFTYFIIRNNHHISAGNCARRSAAMEYLYNFYNSPTVAISAQKLGFAALPQFIASIIVQQLVDHAMCDNGQYALAQYRTSPSPILGAEVFTPTINEYLSAYTAVDPSASWGFTFSDDSNNVWNQYAANPSGISGVFTMFSSAADKIAHYNMSNVLTSAFANMAVVPLYHLNAYSNANSGHNAPLSMTAEIIGGILAGRISNWNDTQIRAANPLTAQYLPNQLITVVVRSLVSDTNALMLRFLTSESPTFNTYYTKAGGNSLKQFNFTTLIPSSRLMAAVTNDRVDSLVTTFDGSFGYYLQYTAPASSIASYCRDPTCAQGAVNPSVLSSITACQDSADVINPSIDLYTYDYMSSTATGCYPIVGTVDYSLLVTTDNTCSQPNATHATVLRNRIKFGSWLFNSSVVVQPLAANAISASSSALRASTFKRICDMTCGNQIYGYEYCGYRDCTWNAGDYTQLESSCNPITETRTVTYQLKPSSTGCIRNPNTAPPSSIAVDCSDVLANYKFGKVCTALAIIGLCVCAAVFAFMVFHRAEKIIKKSQPVFIYIFIIGAFLMNLSIFEFIGPNTDESCLLRPWSINIAVTIMFAPLLMKLHRIDMLFRLSKKLKKTKIPDYKVALQVLGLVGVDVVILILWTTIQRPTVQYFMYTGSRLEEPVPFNACSTTLASPFEQLMVAWKAILLAAGVYKSICTWDKPSDIAEVKHFFLAIYNVSVVGGAMYFFSLYGATSVGAFVLLRCVGIFVSATLPVLIIMIPKFTVIQYKNITGKNLWANNRGSRSKGANISSQGGNESQKAENMLIMKATLDLKLLPNVTAMPNNESSYATPSDNTMLHSRVTPVDSPPETIAYPVEKL